MCDEDAPFIWTNWLERLRLTSLMLEIESWSLKSECIGCTFEILLSSVFNGKRAESGIGDKILAEGIKLTPLATYLLTPLDIPEETSGLIGAVPFLNPPPAGA